MHMKVLTKGEKMNESIVIAIALSVLLGAASLGAADQVASASEGAISQMSHRSLRALYTHNHRPSRDSWITDTTIVGLVITSTLEGDICLCISPDGRYAAVCDEQKKMLRVPLATRTGASVETVQEKDIYVFLNPGSEPIICFAFNYNARLLAAQPKFGSLRLYRFDERNSLQDVLTLEWQGRIRDGECDDIQGFSFASETNKLVAFDRSKVAVFDCAQNPPIKTSFPIDNSQVEDLFLNYNGTLFARLLQNSDEEGVKSVDIWDIGTQRRTASLAASMAAFSPVDNTIACIQGDNVCFYDARAGNLLFEIQQQEGIVRALAFSPDAKTLALLVAAHAEKQLLKNDNNMIVRLSVDEKCVHEEVYFGSPLSPLPVSGSADPISRHAFMWTNDGASILRIKDEQDGDQCIITRWQVDSSF